MPNWCNNIVTIKHKNKTAIDRVVKSYNEGKLCNEFIPTPEELLNTTSPNRTNAKQMKEKYGYEDWYSFQTNEWGTKWDVGGDSMAADRIDPSTVELTFDSAWAPPMGLFSKLTEEGYDVTAYYYEPGSAFTGEYNSYDGDTSYEIPTTSEEVKDQIPSDLDEMFNISASLAEYEEETNE